MDDPDMGVWSYEYDDVGNLIFQTDAKGQIIEFEYDIINRLIEKRGLSPQGTVLVLYTYDDTNKDNCIGRLSKVEDSSGQTEFFYDKLGREIKSTKTVDGTPYTVERTYDILDRLTALTYPDGQVVNYTYDTNSGNLEKVSSTNNQQQTTNYVEDITYDAQGKIKTISYGNNTQTDYTYGQDLRLSHIQTTNNQLQTTFQDLHYDFDKNGNLTTLTDNLRSNIRSYSYDDLDRLTEAQNIPEQGGGYTTFTYQYDPIGNMTYKSDLGVMEYGQGAGPHAVTTAGAYIYRYDANGNMIEGKDRLLSYDPENRLIEVHQSGTTTTTFVYDGDGGRVKKVISDQSSVIGETTYIGSLYELRAEGGELKAVKHIFAGSNKTCTIEPEHTYYTHSDHLGSSNVITNESGTKVSQTEYQPYGKVSQQTGDDVTPYKFTGKELDTTGLYYFGARYYDPEIGRFISADSIVQSPFDPQTLNRYTYCRNNPLKYVDPSGHFFIGLIIAAIIGAVVGGAVAAATGGDIVNGLITGAISGALFFCASQAVGVMAKAMRIKTTAAMIGLKTGVHTITGAASGALGAVATGEDVGVGAAIGAISAGVSAWVGGVFPVDGFIAQGLQRTVVGAILGGGTAMVMGGSFGQGAAHGARTSATAYMTNCGGLIVIPAAIKVLEVLGIALLVSLGIATTVSISQTRGGESWGFYLHGTTPDYAARIDAKKTLNKGSWLTKPYAVDPTTGKIAAKLNPSEYQRFVGIFPPKGEYFVEIFAPESSAKFIGYKTTGAPEYRIYGPHKVIRVYPNTNK